MGLASRDASLNLKDGIPNDRSNQLFSHGIGTYRLELARAGHLIVADFWTRPLTRTSILVNSRADTSSA